MLSFFSPVLAPVRSSGKPTTADGLTGEVLPADGPIRLDALPSLAAQTLSALVRGKVNILVSGGDGSGKTSLLNALTGLVPPGERMVVIEDGRELRRPPPQLESPDSLPRKVSGHLGGALTTRDLVRATLQMRPGRVVVGELRGAEAVELIQAMLIGHAGCMTTLNAISPKDTLLRLETMAMAGGLGLSIPAIRLQVASAVQLIVQVARLQDGARRITHMTEVAGYDVEKQQYRMRELFVRDSLQGDAPNYVVSTLRPCGVLPEFASQLAAEGVSLPPGFLAEVRSAAHADDPVAARRAVAPVFIGEWADRHTTHGHPETVDGWPAAE